jgi:glycosyltransferase involved in cell wall biosynthesis
MQEFYQSLDVFLVTSEVEGGPVTILEALACGVPVIAPSGVGFVNEYDVITYPRGDYDTMVARLRTLIQGRITRRNQVRQRNTPQVYAETHVRIFEEHLK